MHPLVNIAVRAARRAGDLAIRSLQRLESLQVSSKGRNDLVSDVDRAAEQDIIATIHKHYPGHAVLAEEGGQVGPADSEYLWIVDPLDGTTNYLHGCPQFAVSIACEHRGRTEAAVVYDPLRGELFTAARGGGAQLDGRRVRVSKTRDLADALIGTGFPYRDDQPWVDAYLAMLKVAITSTAGVRRPGAASLDLAYVAAGRFDGFFELGLQRWDTAAGALLITEAGGRLGTPDGSEYRGGGHIVGGNPKIYAALLEALAPHVPSAIKG